MRNCCRVAPSLGALEGDPNDVWGTITYNYAQHKDVPTVFFGLYDLRDYIALWRHRGKAWVLWAGSDIVNLRAGFIFNNGKLRWLSKLLRGNWWVRPILKKAEHWVENKWEHDQLLELGIRSKVTPSFMGNVNDYKVSFKPGNKVYLSASEGRQEEYGWWEIEERIAPTYPDFEFHLYGAEWSSAHPNVFCHGRVPKKVMNSQIKHMQGSLRLNKTDGFSEITAKSILWGQWAWTYLPNPFTSFNQTYDPIEGFLSHLSGKANRLAREYYLARFNKYPWCQ